MKTLQKFKAPIQLPPQACTLWVQIGYNEPMGLLEKKKYFFCQFFFFHINEFWNNVFATCYKKCL
jgi:hypothetical protein